MLQFRGKSLEAAEVRAKDERVLKDAGVYDQGFSRSRLLD